MLLHILLFAVGFACLIKGGDWFVDAAVDIAHYFHMPELLIGATVVSIGTTLPEVMVSSASAVSGHGEIAYGNAVGSIICNAALIAAITIIVRPSVIERKSLKIPVTFFFSAAAVFLFMAYRFQAFPRSAGVIFVVMFLVYMVVTVKQMQKDSKQEVQEEEDTGQPEEISLVKSIVMLVVGAAVIAVGAKLLIDHGTYLAKAAGVPESVIGLTLIALGTSLPELITAITSLRKGHGDLSLGNIIGANLFNLVLVCGLSITLSPFSIPMEATLLGRNASLVFDLPVMMAVMLIMTVPSLISGKIRRWQGAVMMAIYIAFCTVQFLM